MMKDEFPEYYPQRLKKVSWCIQKDDGESFAGVMPYYNRHLDYAVKDSQLFLKCMVKTAFINRGVDGSKMVDDAAQYVATHCTCYFSEDEFHFSFKKDKETKKTLFDEDEWMKIFKGTFTKAQSMALLKFILSDVKRLYDGMIEG